jgi:hypothetical protein
VPAISISIDQSIKDNIAGTQSRKVIIGKSTAGKYRRKFKNGVETAPVIASNVFSKTSLSERRVFPPIYFAHARLRIIALYFEDERYLSVLLHRSFYK